MKIAVCISGEMRLFENSLVSDSFKFIHDLNPDIFISTWSHKGFCYNTRKENIFNKRDDIESDLYSKINKSYNNIKSIEVEEYDSWLSNLDTITKTIMTGNLIGGEVITSPPQLYKIFKCNKLKSEYEQQNNFKYDVVIRIRPDLIFLDTPDFTDINSINHINFGRPGAYWSSRIFDIFFYSTSENMDIICDTWNNMNNYIKDDFDNGLDKKDCCRLLYLSTIKNNLMVRDLTTRVCEVYRNENYTDFLNRIKWLNET